jgi:hypothetical protein
MLSMDRFLRTDTCNNHAAIQHDLFWPLHIRNVWQVETISKLPNSNSCKATDGSLSSHRFGRFIADQCRSRIVPKKSFFGSESKGKIEIMLNYLILFLLLKGQRIALCGGMPWRPPGRRGGLTNLGRAEGQQRDLFSVLTVHCYGFRPYTYGTSQEDSRNTTSLLKIDLSVDLRPGRGWSNHLGGLEVSMAYRYTLQGQIDRVESADMHFHALAHRLFITSLVIHFFSIAFSAR